MVKNFLPFLVLSSLFFYLSPVFAQNTVVLNELLPQPSSGSDWIELYNPTSAEVDLSGYKILDTAKTPIKTVELGVKIVASGFLVFEVGTRLNNGGDIIKLIDSAGNPLDEFSYSQSTPDQSYARIPDGTGSWTPASSTKGSSNGQVQQNSAQTPSPQSLLIQVSLSEFMPNPADGKEWVEVHNPSGQAADISGYKIDDIEGGSSPFTIPANTIVNPGAYFVFYFESARFNNEGDSVRLLDSSGQIKDSYTYPDSQKGISFAKDSSSSWSETQTPTPGSANQITKPEDESTGTTAKSSGKTSSKAEGQTPKSESKEPTTSKSTGRTTSTGQVLSLTEATIPALLNVTESGSPLEATGEAAVKSSRVNFLGVFFLILAGGIILGSVVFRFWKERK